MLDFTGNITLNRKSKIVYLTMRTILFLLFVVFLVFLAQRILFPSQYFSFDFDSPNAAKNTIISPRTENQKLFGGDIKSSQEMLFDIPIFGNFSQIQLNFKNKNGSQKMNDAKIIVKKSYQAIFYPETDPVGFKDGSLLKNKEKFFIISDGKILEFRTLATAEKMGYTEKMFEEIFDEELSRNPKGEMITNTNNYPNGSIFKINDDFYQLNNSVLQKFVSKKAYLTNYSEGLAIEKDQVFLNNSHLDKKQIGFSDGTLVSNKEAVFVVDGEFIRPIGDETIFSSFGYDWMDILPADGNELSLYKKTKTFDMSQPHPNGTLFSDKETGQYFLIKNKNRLPIIGPHIIKNYLKRNPIIVDINSLNTSNDCQLKKDWWPLGSYSCTIDITKLSKLIGNDFQIIFQSNNDLNIENINAEFDRTINKEGFAGSLSIIKKRIVEKYQTNEK